MKQFLYFSDDKKTLIRVPKFSEGTVTVPEGVLEIRKNAFSGCMQIKSIKLPSTLTTIQDLAFSECINLIDLTIPQSVTLIGRHIFQGCDNLKAITVSKNYASLSEYRDKITFIIKNGAPKYVFNTPTELADIVKKKIKGQDDVIEYLAVVFFQQYECIVTKKHLAIRTPVLAIGRSGSGKTDTMLYMSEIIGAPYVQINLGSICPISYKGPHIVDSLKEFLKDVPVELHKYAVVVCDEIDKAVFNKNQNIKSGDMSSDVKFMEAMQNDLMQLTEGKGEMLLENGMNMENMSPDYEHLPLEDLLVVFTGSFNNIDKIVSERIKKEQGIDATGFKRNTKSLNLQTMNLQKYIDTQDLLQWGFLSDLIGRIGTYLVFNEPSVDDMLSILKNVQTSPLNEQISYAHKHNIDLIFSDDVLNFIAKKTIATNLGVRGAKALLSKMLSPVYQGIQLPCDTGSSAMKDIKKVQLKLNSEKDCVDYEILR